MNRRPVSRFSPMLENNSRNILASGELKSENLSRNLRVTWLFRKWWEHSWDSKRRGARSEKARTTDYDDEVSPQARVHDVATWIFRGLERWWMGRGWVLSQGKVKETYGSTWESELELDLDLVREFASPVGWRRAFSRPRPSLSLFSFTDMCAMISNKVSTLRFQLDCHPIHS